ncbi:MAG TPA: hypothetical protein VEI49_02585 [Terriglobales bacterium]|nr:hypothetical protein [Terriglobales bacterium]
MSWIEKIERAAVVVKFWGLILGALVIGVFLILSGFGLILRTKGHEPDVWIGFLGIAITLYALYWVVSTLRRL